MRDSVRLSTLAAFLFLVPLVGCGADGPRIVSVTGIVRRAGQPVPHLYLTFEPENGRPSWASSDEQGRFTLKYDRHQDGGLVGTHKVYVDFKPRDPAEEEAFRTGKKSAPAELRAILKKYGGRDRSPLTVVIEKAGQVLELNLD